MENPLLARSLYAVVEVGALVPPEFYYTIAEVLSYVYSLDKNESLKK